MRLSIMGIIVLILVLPLVAFLATTTTMLFSRAAPTPADIGINLTESRGSLLRPWEGLAQGGERDTDGQIMLLGPGRTLLSTAKIRYVRLDHVFDAPSQDRIREIADAGMTPFISLSYFPPSAAASPVGEATDWTAWQEEVTRLVETTSGQGGLNLNGVYYEVWNEPDGENFGRFSVGSGKDYFVLYEKTLEAVLRARNVNPLKIGGPALADPRRCTSGLLFVCQEYWLDRFLKMTATRGLRLDFISWHRYSTNPKDFVDDAFFIGSLISKYPDFRKTERVITEWGSDPARGEIHSSPFDAAHLVAMSRAVNGVVSLAARFEARDGPGQNRDGWGLLTYDGAKKPAFVALELLGRLKSERVNINGEGTYVTGMAAKDITGLTLILVNYDKSSKNTENVPIKISNLISGNYKLTKTTVNSRSSLGSVKTENITIFDGSYQTFELMLPNSVVLWEFEFVQ